MPKPLKLAFDGGCQLTNNERNAVAKQLRDEHGPVKIHITDANLLVQLVGSAI